MSLRTNLLIVVLLWVPGAVHADAIVLKKGGELRGELQTPVREKGPTERMTIRTLTGTLVTVAPDGVERVVRRRAVLEDYETRRRSAGDTVEAQWDLAEWCREKALPRERAVHLQRIVELDPQHVAAHRGLGHVRSERGWTTTEAVMRARGYVKHKGRYVLPQELELIQAEESEGAAAKAWFRRVKLWESWLDSDRRERQANGLSELKSIRDASAVPALSRIFRDNPNQQKRLLYVEILDGIAGDRTLEPLVQQSLRDESQLVRDAAIQGVRRRDVAAAVQIYIRALKNELNVVVNRAATALGQLEDESVIPLLIEALVTRHRYKMSVPQQTISVAADGSLATGVPLPPDVTALLATGQLPLGVRVQEESPVIMKQITVQKDEKNPSVLTALTLLTGEDFGFDEQAWRNWNKSRVVGNTKSPKKSFATN